MPVVEIDPDELRELAGHDKPDEELKADLFGLGLEFEGETEDGTFQLEFAPDRLDRLSVEGVARSLRYQYGDVRGVYVPSTNDAEWRVEVEDVPEERPYVTAAVVRGVDMTEGKLESLIQLQEKLHATMGRKRAKGAIGVHDLAMVKGGAFDGDDRGKTITYTGIDPDGDSFVPLDADTEMTPADVLEDHPVGEKFADLVADYETYPAIYDDIGLFSFPPVINGKRTEVDEGSRDLLVEMTGTDQWTIDRMLAIVCYALDARGGRIEEVDIAYPDRETVRPDLETRTKSVAHDCIESTLGIDLEVEETIDLFERSGLGVEHDDGSYEVEIPPYRTDVLHPMDLVDDVGRAYGFNDLEPRYPDVSTVGGRHDRSKLERAARETLVGLGFEDLLNFHMISERENYERMGIDPESDTFGSGTPVRIEGPYSEDYTMLRTWALPSLAMVLENNTHRAYPQDIAEVGFAAARDDAESSGVTERRTVAGALARPDSSYEDVKARLQTIARNFGAELETPATTHPSFIDGRAASVVIDEETVGVVGELHPRVLVEHDLEVPVAAFEFDLAALR
ncbi:phenylalanine--tRNA ligase subunit beta [Halosegnis rubeus]|uniref:Phenylalanine--tRNA ligase beta subunit n=1 Tax=Halosegnis rubeus TaxID=2212850 RepID=A0A5N5UJB5_9EURY|nr:phenylalanine--tRNA ligase subunit beta [Halosegnis rubeus]KAB7517749.1 phenylalanine--tRNA ligase subunit beta [Halosegnis rubeus]